MRIIHRHNLYEFKIADGRHGYLIHTVIFYVEGAAVPRKVERLLAAGSLDVANGKLVCFIVVAVLPFDGVGLAVFGGS